MNLRIVTKVLKSSPLVLSLSAALLTSSLTLASPHSAVVPVWKQQIQVAIDEYMAHWIPQARLSAETRVEYRIDDLDPRLNLNPCGQTPAVENNRDARSGKLTVRVSCQGDKPWSVFVSLELQRFHPVVHLVNTLPRNTILDASDLTIKETNIDDLRYGFFTTIEDATNMTAKRSLNAGEPLIPNQVSPPKLVRKGDSVLIEASNPSITVKMPGLAMADGRKGQQIPVKNTQSNRMVRAKVVDHGRVKVPL